MGIILCYFNGVVEIVSTMFVDVFVCYFNGAVEIVSTMSVDVFVCYFSRAVEIVSTMSVGGGEGRLFVILVGLLRL